MTLAHMMGLHMLLLQFLAVGEEKQRRQRAVKVALARENNRNVHIYLDKQDPARQ